ncbi:MAG: hypothetical protein RLZZ618_2767 [Pseudomonadota bacterium]|jgi:hypothetical protein
MNDFSDIFELQQLVARFANSFDTKDWAALEQCLMPELHTDYSDLRGTPPERMSNTRFVALRRSALSDLQTHHLSGNVEIKLCGSTAALKVSMAIHRRDVDGGAFNTHCLYLMGAERAGDPPWRINSIVQKVFINDGDATIHSGLSTP